MDDLKWGLLYFIRNPSLVIPSYCSVLTCLWFLYDTGDTLYYRFTSDMSNTEWGYKFTVTAGHLGRFQTGVCSSLSLTIPCQGHYVSVSAIMSLIFIKIKAGIFL